jgi:integrase
MLRALNPRRLDVLRAIKSGVVTIPDVFTAWQSGSGDELPTVESFKPLDHETWSNGADCSEAQRRNHRQAFRSLLDGEPKGATVADVPRLLRAYKGRAGGRVMFNRVKASVLAYLRDELGRRHALYEAVQDIAGYTEKPAPGVKMSPDEVRAVAKSLDGLGPMVWALALSGMRRGEYWGKWEVWQDRYRIFGTKTEAAVRDVPYLGPIVAPLCTYNPFRKKLKTVRPDVSPHDFRHTYMHWMDEAGISRIRRKLYLGHASGDVSDIYDRHEITGFLVTDAARLREYIGDIPTPLRKVG